MRSTPDVHIRVRAALVGVLSTSLLSLLTVSPAVAESAAELDWQTFAPCGAPGCPGEPVCGGSYVEPDWLTPTSLDDPDRIDADANSGEQQPDGDFILTGDVWIRQGSRHIRTGSAVLNQDKDLLRLDGGVMIRQPGLLMTGSSGEATISTRQASLENASFLLHDNQLRGEAASLDHTEGDVVVISRGTFTRCEPGNRSWYLAGRSIELDRAEGFGSAQDLTLRIRDVPIAYIPYLKFPIDDRRHSGLLMPGLSYDSEGGADLSIPYYFNLAPNYDATWTPRFMWDRGLVNELQLRWITSRSSNEINGAFLYRDRIYDDRTTIDRTGDEATFTEPFKRRNRWALNVRHTGGWAQRWQTTLRYNALSDTEYLHDIGAEVDQVAKEQFYSRIDQSVGNRRSVALDRLADLTYQGDYWQYRLRLQGYQNLFEEGREHYQRMPQMLLTFERYHHGVEYDLSGEYVYFTREDSGLAPEERVIGSRIALEGAVAYPIRGRFGYVTPRAAVEYRGYDLKHTLPGTDATPSVTVPVLSVDAGLYFERHLANGDGDRVQTLEPRLYFLSARFEEQSLLPNFDTNELTRDYEYLFRANRFVGKDRIADARQLSAGLMTRVLDRGGVEVLRAAVGQIYYFRDRRVELATPLPGLDPAAHTSALYGEVSWVPEPGWHFEGALEWNPRDGQTARGHASIRYRPDLNHIVNLSYHVTDRDRHALPLYEDVEESDLSFVWPVRTRWSLVGRWNFDWDRDQTIESLLGVEYRNCCWRSRLVLRRFLKDPRSVTLLVEDPANPGNVLRELRVDHRAATGVFFEIQLKGLATLGRKLNALLNDGIVGYAKREEAIDF